jgi:hypothetical protein
MKKLTIILLSLTIIIGNCNVYASTLESLKEGLTTMVGMDRNLLQEIKGEMAKDFKDFDENGWYAENLAKLAAVNGIHGYSDGSIKPNGLITRAEFIKILVASLYGAQEGAEGNHWAMPYVNKALEIGVLKKEDISFDILNLPITRQEIAKMTILVTQSVYKEPSESKDIGIVVTDMMSIKKEYVEYIRDAYSKGIITGYPDRTVRASATATRAEASAMLVRLMDKDQRPFVEIHEWSGRRMITFMGYYLPFGDTTDLAYSFPQEAGEPELLMILLVHGKESGLGEQWDAVKIALNSKYSKETVVKVMESVMLKTNKSQRIIKTTVKEGNKSVTIESNEDSYFIHIKAYIN